jgi:Flp pilus assembly protein TadD
MRLEFSAPRELHNQRAGDNVASLTALYSDATAPAPIRNARARAGVVEWRNRGAMMAKADVFGRAYDDFASALGLDLTDAEALDGFVRTATITGRASEALTRLDSLRTERRDVPGPISVEGGRAHVAAVDHPRVLVAVSKLQAASGARDDAVATARRALEIDRTDPVGAEQMASLMADGADTIRLEQALDVLRHLTPEGASTYYYDAVLKLLRGNLPDAQVLAERGMGLHPTYAPFYDLVGAIYTKRGDVFRARWAFNQSLAYDAHDSTAYENLGLIALETGDRAAARNYFAEALWLVPGSRVAREGLARAR